MPKKLKGEQKIWEEHLKICTEDEVAVVSEASAIVAEINEDKQIVLENMSNTSWKSQTTEKLFLFGSEVFSALKSNLCQLQWFIVDMLRQGNH